MRHWILLLIFLSFSNLAFGEIHFSDVPKDFWAESAVYNLVKMGVIDGYPDGTFKGNKKISRYEMASLLSKLSKNVSTSDQSAYNKIFEELKTELAYKKYKILSSEGPKIGIDLQNNIIIGNLLANTQGPHGPRLSYRLKLSIENKHLKLRLDTMDCGFDGGNRDFTQKLIDGELKFNLSNIEIKANAGPGISAHRETDFINPSDDYKIYIRPKTQVKASTAFNRVEISAAYVTRSVSLDGVVGVSEFTGDLTLNYPTFPYLRKARFTLRPRYLFKAQGDVKDVRGEIIAEFYPHKKIDTLFLLGVGSVKSTHGLYAKTELSFKDLFISGNSLSFIGHKAGSEYRVENLDKYEFVYLNYFDKLVLDGSVDLGLKYTQPLWGKFDLTLVTDWVLSSDFKIGEDHAGTSQTSQIMFSYKLYPSATIKTFYRVYAVPSGLSSKDPLLSESVPTLSDLWGLTVGINL